MKRSCRKGSQYGWLELLLLIILAGACFTAYKSNHRATESQRVEVTQEKLCYLTFDDGPSKYTEDILQMLAEYDAKATFFVIGAELTQEREKLLTQIIKEGHAIGLHSYAHSFEQLYSSPQNCLQDFKKEQEILAQNFGIQTNIFRFPGGSACRYMNGNRKQYVKTMQQADFLCYDWNVSGEDAVEVPTAASIKEHVLTNVEDYKRPIILLHDTNAAAATREALPEILETITGKGYRLVSLEGAEEYVYR